VSSAVYEAFASALGGKNERVVLLPHPRITFLAQNFNGKAALVARISLRLDQVVSDGKGFTVATDRSGSDDFVRIASIEVGASLLFLKLVDYVLERTADASDADEAAALLVTAVDEFRRFSQRKAGRLSEEEIRGLVAEILLLKHLHAGDKERTWDVFHSWGGPFGALHDFEFAAGNAIEVKSTHRPPSEIRISVPAQARAVPDGLDLVVLPLEKVAPGADADVVFHDLIAEVGVIAASHGGDVADLWESALTALGLDVSDEFYGQWRFLRGEWLRFVVTDDFPGIREADISPAVIKVSYSLRLDALSDFTASFDELDVMP
jgi:hypothetical protein